ncbi:hypothetical protein AAFF_G00388320 [Aldrovandia affinis]|uniref:Uncharacterized protein n=1 Tax=Aldrovandia affinis TaxID=143900 RepID=A0AAD7WLM0_9TELE|nr:hypothetical protein AAFF_G00388320 [Aldrovandia affinis]
MHDSLKVTEKLYSLQWPVCLALLSPVKHFLSALLSGKLRTAAPGVGALPAGLPTTKRYLQITLARLPVTVMSQLPSVLYCHASSIAPSF